MRGRAGRAAAPQGRPVGRHERRRPVTPPERHLHPVPSGTPATPTTRAGRMTRAATSTRAGRNSRAAGGSRVVRVTRISLRGRLVRRARGRWAAQVAEVERAREAANGPRPRGAADGPRHLAGARVRRADWNEDALTTWSSVLLVIGLYLGGWNQQRPLEGGAAAALTPVGGLLYLGFAAVAVWVLTRHLRRGDGSPRAVAAGDRLGPIGMALALAALVGEAVWSLLGGGAGLARPLSPFQVLLVCGATLLVSSALRAAWSEPTSARVPGLRAFWPVVLSGTLVVAVAAYVLQDVAPVVAWHRAAPAAGAPVGTDQAEALLGLLAHNLLFVAPVLLLLRRWRTPLGTFTVMAGSVALLLATQTGFALVGLVGAAVVGGAATDVAVHLLRPSPQRPWAVRSVALIGPAVYWTAHYALLEVGYGVGTAPEVWLGSVAWAALTGFALALHTWPPAVPLTAWNRGRARTRAPATATATATPLAARTVGR
jgi:hypothetical protein